MNAQSIYTLSDRTIRINAIDTNGVYRVGLSIRYNDTSMPTDIKTLYVGFNYDEALKVYNQACASHVFLPDYCERLDNGDIVDTDTGEVYHKHNSSESGQAAILLLIVIVAVIVCLYVAYTGISEASTGTNNMFGYMVTKLSEVLR